MIEVRPMEPGDLEALDRDEIDAWSTREAFADVTEMQDWIGNAFTAVENGRPIGISGFALDDNGTGMGWLIGSRQLRERPVFLHRTMRRVLDHIRNHPKVRRIEITVLVQCDEAVRWAERLGFKREAANAGFARYVLEA